MSDRAPVRVFYGRIERGKPILEAPEDFGRLKQSLEGHDIEIILRKRRKDRSTPQNRYYWGCVIRTLSEFTGHSPEEVHESLKHKFLIEHGDEQLPRVKSTASLDTAEFARYVDDCIRLAAEFGCIIPDPNEVA